MNTDQTAASSSPYIAYYGMTREPFGSAVEDELFYPEPTRKQRLEILLHLTQYGDELMLLTGPAGSGKTTLLQQFQKQALDTWSIARIEATGGINDQQLLEQLFRQLNLDFQADSQDALLEKITHHYESLQRSARQGVIIMDDAEQLHIATLKNILALAALTNADDKPLIRIILVGTEELETLLQDSEIQQHANIPQRVIDLHAFDREQTAHYILHRLSAANFSDTKPFTDSAINKLYKQSGGWPGRINELADELLTTTLPAKPKAKDKGESRSILRPLRNVSIGLLIVVVVSLLMFQEQINTWLEPAETTTRLPLPLPELADSQMADTMATAQAPALPASPEQEAAMINSGDTPVASEALVESSEPALTDTVMDTPQQTEESMNAQMSADEANVQKELLEKQAANIDTTEPVIPVPASKPPVVKEEALPVDVVEVKEEIKAEIKEEPKPAPAPVATPVKKEQPLATAKVPTKPSPSLDLPLQQNEWLLQQNPAHFTLQLVAGNNVDTIRRFIREHGLQDKLALYETRRDGKPWYVLLYGMYVDKPKAIDARDHLPANLRKAKPWIRDLGGIQGTLQ